MDRLIASVQPYAWGDPNFIPELQSREPTGEPEAELWMGAHPKAPARLATTDQSLDAAIEANPIALLGAATAERFGRLPFLTKVLAAAQPLSIQSHPSLTQAIAGYARENEAGVALDAPDRTYRDDNHKPEVICALTPFEAKCGFRALDRTRELFASLDDPGLDPLRAQLAGPGTDGQVLGDTLTWLLRLDDANARDLVAATVAASAQLTSGPFAADAAWSSTLDGFYPGDIGVTVALLLNHVVLEPGEAVFLEAGNLHAYLKGSGIELMANSDNVVRGGLTPKHIDIDELLDVVDCTPIDAPVQAASSAIHTFDTPVPEFALTRLDITEPQTLDGRGPEILVITEGRAALATAGGDHCEVGPGEPVWISAADNGYTLAPLPTGDADRVVAFRTTPAF